MDRRALVIGAATVFATSTFVEGQQPRKLWRIGVLSELSQSDALEGYWRNALKHRGYVEGENAILTFRFASGVEALPALATALVQWKPDVILTGSTPPAVAAKRATATVPIITISAEPVRAGLAASLAHPGGNVTGVFVPLEELGTKRLQLLREVVPDLPSVAILWNPGNQAAKLQLESVQAAARTLHIATYAVELRSQGEIDAAFTVVLSRGPRALVVIQDPVTRRASGRIAEMTATHRLPASHAYREFADLGGLMSYGANLVELFNAAAVYADRVLKGAKPEALPMEQPTRFEFVINLKTARALNLTIPPSLLLRADQVIE
jgi:ABC-type uncharacterized transport system substrate-binding protein